MISSAALGWISAGLRFGRRWHCAIRPERAQVHDQRCRARCRRGRGRYLRCFARNSIVRRHASAAAAGSYFSIGRFFESAVSLANACFAW